MLGVTPKVVVLHKNNVGKRNRYWDKHGGRPSVKRHVSKPGMQQRLMQTNILNTVHELGKMSDVAIVKAGGKDGVTGSLAFSIHQQKFFGSLDRLKKQNPFRLKIPHKVLSAGYRSAFKVMQDD